MSFLDTFMLICFVVFLIFMLRGVAIQTAKKDEIRRKFKENNKERE